MWIQIAEDFSLGQVSLLLECLANLCASTYVNNRAKLCTLIRFGYRINRY